MEDILKALGWRYAVKIFDPAKKVADEDFKTILESGRLAPSSLGIEPWKFIVVENVGLREKLRAASYGQPKVTDASHLIVIARRTDARESMVSELMERAMAIQHVGMSSLSRDIRRRLAEQLPEKTTLHSMLGSVRRLIFLLE